MRQPKQLKPGRGAARPVLFAIASGVGLAFCATSPVAGDEPPNVAARITPDNTNVQAQPAAKAQPAAANAVREHQLVPFLRMARDSRDAVASVRDYQALFTKQELVGRTVYNGRMLIKLRHEPFSVYLKFVDHNAGREVLYAGPHYQGKMMAHEAPGTLSSIVGTVSLEPTSARAMAEGRHPITEIGMAKMMESLMRQWEGEMTYKDPEDPKVYYYPNAKLAGQIECQAAITRHENPKHQFRFYETRVFFDKKSNFPIRLEQYGFPDRAHPEGYLVEQYIYTNIKVNVGMTDADFDVHNRSYKF
jgi:hypothetical protein